MGLAVSENRSWATKTPPEALSIELSMSLADLEGKLSGACELWRLWGEEEGRAVDVESFARSIVNYAMTGTGTVLVAFTEYGQPVGMATVGWDYDPAKSRRRCIGERLYVIPEYRNRSVFRALWDAGEVYAWLVGAEEHVVSFRADSHLRYAYEARGFRVTDVLMKREANHGND